MKFENKSNNHKPFTYVNNNVKLTMQSEEKEIEENINENNEIIDNVEIENTDVINECPVEILETESITTNIKAIVTDCERLNVRSNPDINSDVLKIINNGDKLNIIDLNENSEFYKIIIDNVEGYCMKKFITTVNE